jgi:hypothetical protein
MRLLFVGRKGQFAVVCDPDEGAQVANLIDLSRASDEANPNEATDVVRRAEDGDTQPIVLHRVAFLSDLMAPDQRRDLVRLRPPLSDVRAEAKADTSLRRPAPRHVLRVRPERLAKDGPADGLLLLDPVDLAHVLEADAVVGKEAAVDDKVPLRPVWPQSVVLRFGQGVRPWLWRLWHGDEGGHGQSHEALFEKFVLSGASFVASQTRAEKTHRHLAKLLLDLAQEAIDAVHVFCLVVAAVEEDVLGVEPLVREPRQHDFG